MLIKNSKGQTDYALKDMPSMRALFEAPASLGPLRMVRTVGAYWMNQAAVDLGITGTSVRQWRDTYDALALYFRQTGDNPLECNCIAPTGLRWIQADNKEPVTVFMHESLTVDMRRDLMTAMALIQAEVENLKFEITEDDLAPVDIYIDQGVIDGTGSTLGVTRFTRSEDMQDLNNAYAVNLYIRFDEAENWFITNLFLAVGIHEIGHGVGVDHIEGQLDNMNSRLTQILTTITDGFAAELIERYLSRKTVTT